MEITMRTIQMTLDDELVESVDKLVKILKTTRSAFTRRALQEALNHYQTKVLEERHRHGYELHPITKDEFGIWEKEQKWGDE